MSGSNSRSHIAFSLSLSFITLAFFKSTNYFVEMLCILGLSYDPFIHFFKKVGSMPNTGWTHDPEIESQTFNWLSQAGASYNSFDFCIFEEATPDASFVLHDTRSYRLSMVTLSPGSDVVCIHWFPYELIVQIWHKDDPGWSYAFLLLPLECAFSPGCPGFFQWRMYLETGLGIMSTRILLLLGPLSTQS